MNYHQLGSTIKIKGCNEKILYSKDLKKYYKVDINPSITEIEY